MIELVWNIAFCDYTDEKMVHVPFDNAIAHGMPLQGTWHIAVHCTENLALEGPGSAEEARSEMVEEDVECILLGRPRSANCSGQQCVAGSMVHLTHEDAKQDFLEASHVE